MKTNWVFCCSALITLCCFINTGTSANIETDGFGIVHTFPVQGNYTAPATVSFTDGFTWTARRVTPLQSPDSITATPRDGYSRLGVTTVVSQVSKSHSWTGTDITDWTDSASLSGSVVLVRGSYGYWADIQQVSNGAPQSIWVNQLTGNPAKITGGFNVN